MSEKVYILDEIVVSYTETARLREAYLSRYVPDAKARGMVLEGKWQSPPIDLPERRNVLHFLWSVPDVAGWWRMRLGQARANPNLDVNIEGDDHKLRWWRYVDAIAESRKRTFMQDIGDDDV